MFAIIRFLLVFLCSFPLWASTPTWYNIDANKQVSINVDLFLSSTCPHCHKADEFFKEIEPANPWLHVQRHVINQDKDALVLFNQFLTQQNANDFAVPSIFFCDSRWVGFVSAETTGKDLLNGLHYCKQQIEKKGKLDSASVSVIKRWANANLFNASIDEKPTILQYLITVVFLDTATPCSAFVIFSLLSILFIQQSKKNQFFSGCLFIFAIILVHYLQQTHTNFFFQILPWYRIIAFVVALVSLYLVREYYNKHVFKPNQLFLWIFFFAVTVYAYQQTCLMNWSYIFQQWLTNQQLATGQELALQLIYQILYALPMIVTLLVYLLVSSFKHFSTLKPSLEQIGLAFLTIAAVIMLILPSLFSVSLLSYLLFVVAVIAGVISNRARIKRESY